MPWDWGRISPSCGRRYYGIYSSTESGWLRALAEEYRFSYNIILFNADISLSSTDNFLFNNLAKWKNKSMDQCYSELYFRNDGKHTIKLDTDET